MPTVRKLYGNFIIICEGEKGMAKVTLTHGPHWRRLHPYCRGNGDAAAKVRRTRVPQQRKVEHEGTYAHLQDEFSVHRGCVAQPSPLRQGARESVCGYGTVLLVSSPPRDESLPPECLSTRSSWRVGFEARIRRLRRLTSVMSPQERERAYLSLEQVS